MREDESQWQKKETLARKKNNSPFIFMTFSHLRNLLDLLSLQEGKKYISTQIVNFKSVQRGDTLRSVAHMQSAQVFR